MRQSGCTLAQILEAGQWQSAAFMTYMDEVKLQKVCISHESLLFVCTLYAFVQDVAFAIAVDSDEDSD